MGRARDRVYFAALAVLGSAALALSYTLEPTPGTFMWTRDYGRIPVDPTMHAVDYLIIALRVGGVVALAAGAYLTYRRFRPDRIKESEGVGGHIYDKYGVMEPEGGNPGVRSGIG